MQACEQLSLFSIVPQAARTAICCMDGECKAAAPAESWMADLVPGGEYAISIAGHTLVLKPVPGTPAGIQRGTNTITTPSARACTREHSSGGCSIENS